MTSLREGTMPFFVTPAVHVVLPASSTLNAPSRGRNRVRTRLPHAPVAATLMPYVHAFLIRCRRCHEIRRYRALTRAPTRVPPRRYAIACHTP